MSAGFAALPRAGNRSDAHARSARDRLETAKNRPGQESRVPCWREYRIRLLAAAGQITVQTSRWEVVERASSSLRFAFACLANTKRKLELRPVYSSYAERRCSSVRCPRDSRPSGVTLER